MIVINLRYVFSLLLFFFSCYMFYNTYWFYCDSKIFRDFLTGFPIVFSIASFIIALVSLFLSLYISGTFHFLGQFIKFEV